MAFETLNLLLPVRRLHKRSLLTWIRPSTSNTLKRLQTLEEKVKCTVNQKEISKQVAKTVSSEDQKVLERNIFTDRVFSRIQKN